MKRLARLRAEAALTSIGTQNQRRRHECRTGLVLIFKADSAVEESHKLARASVNPC